LCEFLRRLQRHQAASCEDQFRCQTHRPRARMSNPWRSHTRQSCIIRAALGHEFVPRYGFVFAGHR
jgi:hypothetical protein